MVVRETPELIKVTRVRKDVVHVYELGPGDIVTVDHDDKLYAVQSEPYVVKKIEVRDPTHVQGGTSTWERVDNSEIEGLVKSKAFTNGSAAWQVDLEPCK